MTKWKIYNEDAVEWAKNYQKGKFHALLTDAPYHLTSIVKRFGKASMSDDTQTSDRARRGVDGYSRLARGGFMGATWDGGDIAFRPETWEAFKEVLYPGAFGMAFSASRNWHRMAVAIEDAGFIIHPTMFFLWVQGQGFPKATNIATNIYKHIDRWIGDMYNEWEESICQNNVSDVENQQQDRQEDFVVVNVSTITNKSLLRDLRVIIAELSSPEVSLLSKIPLTIVQENVGQNTKPTKSPVNGVEKYSEHLTAFLNSPSAPSHATIYQCENLPNRLKEGEVLKIGLGNLLFSKETITNVNYVELIDALKRIILNKSKTFQNLDMKSQMVLLSAITVIITKFTMGCLTSSMGDIVKERTPNFEGHRYGLQALKPSVEPIIVFQKPYEGKPLDNIVSTGAGALNIDGGRIPLATDDEYTINTFDDGAKPFGNGAGHKYSSRPVKWTSPRGGIWSTDKDAKGELVESGQGRWPSNLILDETSAEKLDMQTGQLVSGKPSGKKHAENNIYGQYKNEDVDVQGFGDAGGASRFFYQVSTQLDEADPFLYQSKVSPKERNAGLDEMPVTLRGSLDGGNDTRNGKNKPQLHPTKNNHPTLKPINLAKYLATLLLPPVEYAPRRIFIPFSGSGSEMIGAGLAGWEHVVGVEFDTENGYVDIAQKRLEHWLKGA